MSSYDSEKNEIRQYLKKLKSLPTPLHDITDLKHLGEGGTSVVYSGHFNKIPVAIKFLAVDMSSSTNEQRVLRFKDEITGLITLTGKPHITPIILVQKIDIATKSYLYFVMPKFITLKEYIKSQKKIASKDLYHLAKGIMEGVDILHQNKIIHRDLKPENIFLDQSSNILIGDFGIAWFDNDYINKLASTKKGERIGNYEFSAPEQAKGATASATMDIYAVGQLLQWLFTGSAHRGTARAMVSTNHAEFSFLDKVIPKMMANSPSDRLQTMLGVYNEIESAKTPPNTNVINSDRLFSTVNRFDDVLREVFSVTPGKFITSSKESKIDKFLDRIHKYSDDISPWKTTGWGTNSIEKIKKIGRSKWLLEFDEIKIEKIIVYYSQSPYQNFALVITKPDKKLNIPQSESESDGEYGFIPLFLNFGIYISRNEYDHGYFDKLGLRFKVPKNHELRCRSFKKKAFLIGAEYSSILDQSNDQLVEQCLVEFETSWNTNTLLPLTRLRKYRQIV